jgi:hypothetical protein
VDDRVSLSIASNLVLVFESSLQTTVRLENDFILLQRLNVFVWKNAHGDCVGSKRPGSFPCCNPQMQVITRSEESKHNKKLDQILLLRD